MLQPLLAASVLTLAALPAPTMAQAAAAPQPAAATASAATPASAEPAADPNKRICKRFASTGSMIASRRECRTAAEWTRIAEAAQAHGQDVIDRGRSGIIGN